VRGDRREEKHVSDGKFAFEQKSVVGLAHARFQSTSGKTRKPC
jgi:hypothetical protein